MYHLGRFIGLLLAGLLLFGCSPKNETGALEEQSPETSFLKSENFGAGKAVIPQNDEYHSMATVPAGNFLMGLNNNSYYLEEFRIDRYEVLQDDFRACVKAGACTPTTSGGSWSGPLMPVGNVDWYQASTYCHWLGKRLPTSQEWEKAARGPDGGHRYPWGDQWDPTYANWCDSEQFPNDGIIPAKPYPCEGTIDGYAFAAPINAFPQNTSPYGVRQMCGNQLEWTSTYSETGYGKGYAVRGGAWWGPRGMGIPNGALMTWSEPWDPPYGTPQHMGFRCAE